MRFMWCMRTSDRRNVMLLQKNSKSKKISLKLCDNFNPDSSIKLKLHRTFQGPVGSFTESCLLLFPFHFCFFYSVNLFETNRFYPQLISLTFTLYSSLESL